MISPDKSSLPRFVAWCGLALLAAVMLWLAIWLIQQIWIPLLVVVLVVTIGWISFRIIRWRRDRWLR